MIHAIRAWESFSPCEEVGGYRIRSCCAACGHVLFEHRKHGKGGIQVSISKKSTTDFSGGAEPCTKNFLAKHGGCGCLDFVPAWAVALGFRRLP